MLGVYLPSAAKYHCNAALKMKIPLWDNNHVFEKFCSREDNIYEQMSMVNKFFCKNLQKSKIFQNTSTEVTNRHCLLFIVHQYTVFIFMVHLSQILLIWLKHMYLILGVLYHPIRCPFSPEISMFMLNFPALSPFITSI